MKLLMRFFLSMSCICAYLEISACNNPSWRSADSLQLVNLYNSANGIEWSSPWIDSGGASGPINTWKGIKMANDQCRVEEISISDTNLSGTIPVLNLPGLKKLVIVGDSRKKLSNIVSGTIPSLDSLQQLESLQLRFHNFQDSFISFTHPFLRNLVIENSFADSLFIDVDLPNLRSITLTNNKIKGILPTFHSSDSLSGIDLRGNGFSGEIHAYDHPRIKTIYLTGNVFDDTIPDFNLPQLETLVISKNIRALPFPRFTHLSMLKHLELIEMSIISLPDTIELPSLTMLNLSGNSINNLPDTLVGLSGLTSLNLSKNLIPGKLKGSLLESFPLLTVANLSGNLISGIEDIPESQSGNLLDINLEDNIVSSLSDFSGYTRVKKLNLIGNKICGTLHNFMNLPNLEELFLTRNQISGNIPVGFIESLPSLVKIDLDENFLVGQIPDFSSNTLTHFDADFNYLTGPLPPLNGAVKLIHFDFDYNFVSGPIPDYHNRPGGGNMTLLEVAHNRFNFSDIANYNHNRSGYRYQGQVIPIEYDFVNHSLSVDAGFVTSEAENTYTWRRVCPPSETITELTTAGGTEFALPAQDNCFYWCVISNSIITISGNTYKDLVIQSDKFVNGNIMNSLCEYDVNLMGCADMQEDGSICYPLIYEGPKVFLGGKTEHQIIYNRDLLKGDGFINHQDEGDVILNDDDLGEIYMSIEDFDQNFSQTTLNDEVLGCLDFDFLHENIGINAQMNLENEVLYNSDCSVCENIDVDFLYIELINVCEISKYNAATKEITLVFEYHDHALNTANPQFELYYYTNDASLANETLVDANNVQFDNGRIIASFILRPEFSGQFLRYKINAVSQSGRRFEQLAKLRLSTHASEFAGVFIGNHDNAAINVPGTIRNVTCDTHWYYEVSKSRRYQNIEYDAGRVYINDNLVYNGSVQEKGDQYRRHFRQGAFKIDHLPACYTIRAQSSSSTIRNRLLMDYKFSCLFD